MDLQGLSAGLMAGDSRLVDHIVGEVKSQGIFDKFRKECIADVDTKPAYQNLRTRVEGSVNSFLNKQTWRTDLNKTQLRETLRKHIHDAPYLEVGVERIVDQVVNPKIYSVFMPQIEDVVYKYLGIERPKSHRNGTVDLKDLLPKDLDPISPESDRNSLKDTFESMDDITNDAVIDSDQKPSCSNIEEKTQIVEDPEIKLEFVKKEEFIKDEFENKEENERKEKFIQKEEPVRQQELMKKEENNVENNMEICSSETISPVKALLNCSIKSDDTNKMDEEEEASPVFEPIDIMNLNESNMSNDSHLSGISELTSHRSRSPDFMTEFSRDNFDCSNQDSQLSKVSSGSRLSIVTDFGSSNHASTPVPDSKEDSKGAKDDFKYIKDFDSSKDKFNFDVIKNKDKEYSKISCSSKESSRDASDYKESRNKEESKSKTSKDRYDSKSSRDKDRDSRRHRSSKSDRYSHNRSKDKNESQESLDSGKSRDSKTKATDKKDDGSNKAKDLKDLYKEKIRELWEKKELTEKEKLSRDSKDSSKVSKDKDSKDRKESSSSTRDKDDNRRSHKSSSSSSSRSSSYHKNAKESRDRSSSNKHDDRRHSNGKSSSSSSRSSNKRDSKSDSHSRDRDSSRKRRDEKKSSKSTDDHSSLRKSSNDRRSSDRDGSNGSNSKYSYKTPSNSSAYKLGPSTSLTIDNKDHSSGETPDNVHDSMQAMSFSLDAGQPRHVDPGSTEICLPLKKRPLQSDESSSGESPEKKPRLEVKRNVKKRKINDVFKSDGDVTSVPDEERVQIIEITEEDYEQPYSDKEEPVLSLEDTKNIIFNAEPVINPVVNTVQSKLSEMEQSIRDSLTEMMSDHGVTETDNTLITNKLLPVIDSTSSLIETLTDDSLEASLMDNSNIITSENVKETVESKDKEDIETVQKFLKECEPQNENEVKQQETIKDTLQENDENKQDYNTSKLEKMNEYLKSNVVSDKNFEVEIEKVSESIETCLDKTEENNKLVESKTDTSVQDYIEKIDENSVDSNKVIEIEKNTDIRKNHDTCIIKEDIDVSDNEKIQDIHDDPLKIKENLDFDTKKATTETEYLVEKLKQDIEKSDIEIKELEKKENTEDSIDNTEISKQQSKKNEVDNLYQDEESIDNNTSDEFNEDKLVIDEEFEQKDQEDNKEINSKVTDYKESNSTKFLDSGAKSSNDVKNDNEMSIVVDSQMLSEILNKNIDGSVSNESINELDKDPQMKVSCNVEDKQQIEISESNKVTEKIEESNSTDKIDEDSITVEKQTEFTKISKNNFNDNTLTLKLIKDKTVCKSLTQDKKEKIKNSDVEKLVTNTNETTIKLKKNAVIKNTKDKDKEQKNNLSIVCGVKKKVKEKSLKLIKVGVKAEKQVPFIKSVVPDKSSSMLLKSDRIEIVASPVEEDCRYFENDNHDKYLQFKQFLDKLEANPNQSSVDIIKKESNKVIATTFVSLASRTQQGLKHKLTSSLLSDIIPNSSELDSLTKDVVIEDSSERPTVSKKRKLGRAKKISGSASQMALQQQQAESTVEQQQLQQQQMVEPGMEQQSQQSEVAQQAPAALVNGENIMFPLNIDNDGEKKDEKGRNRSKQRYSSDDLYKPRPLFSSSSRRNRRFNNPA